MSDVVIPAGDRRLRGHLAIPAGDGPWPGVVVIHDALGMTTDLRSITDRFAIAGYLAIAPSLDGAPRPTTGLSHRNLLAARQFLISDSRCTGTVGLAGFSMAAGFCLQLAPGGLFASTASGDGARASRSFMNQHPLPAPFRLVAGIAGLAHRAPEAEDAWQRILAFFADHLGASDGDLGGVGRR
ncbi:dienelactone hydrolase family protein [Mycobacterium sp. shizuoka-1]|uniref:dienelactone hydrolase family protein n=1 Tax=Mycobacterium sp. shizuoka-1 TaxID=2039281 RepID=UPI000C066B11|nr:dienelactone hydrolase family protein [Mycobacterium sp. shizuoka-1]GAY14279.1 carboxymethylenebutenolidase [Mycobacterium sp. shizuoka-1]